MTAKDTTPAPTEAAKPAQVTVEHENGEVRVIPAELVEDFKARGFTTK